MSELFVVETEIFQGPLDLLLNLIEKRKLLINEVSLAKITDDYLNFLNSGHNVSLKNNAHFILVAATLVLIKSKSLLPGIELTEEETQSVEDLETRLKIYQKIKSVEPWIRDNFGKSQSHLRLENDLQESFFAPSKNLSVGSLFSSIKNIIKCFPKPEKIPHRTVKKIISLEESITNLTSRIKQAVNLNFKDFTLFGKAEKIDIVVDFLAMLELIKQGTINVVQNNNYGDIEMQTCEIDTPNYS